MRRYNDEKLGQIWHNGRYKLAKAYDCRSSVKKHFLALIDWRIAYSLSATYVPKFLLRNSEACFGVNRIPGYLNTYCHSNNNSTIGAGKRHVMIRRPKKAGHLNADLFEIKHEPFPVIRVTLAAV